MLLFRFYGEIKSFTDKEKLKEFSTTIPASMEKALATHSSTLFFFSFFFFFQYSCLENPMDGGAW